MTASSKTQSAIPKRSGTRAFLLWGAVAIIQLALISIPLVDRLQVQMGGTVVPLELVPVDPRDLLRGDYVIINLAITQVSTDVPGSKSVAVGDDVFVGLRSEGKTPAVPVVVARNREDAGDLAIKGIVRSTASNQIRVDYDIDAFFLPEGEGLIVEQLDLDRVLLEVSIAPDGRSLPLTLLVDGKVFNSDSNF